MRKFLYAAEQVLNNLRAPMNVKDIVDKAQNEGILRSNGKTPYNTMRARLSEHIRMNGDNSIFMRVDRNKFALRNTDFKEYKAKPFEKEFGKETVICFSRNQINALDRIFGFSKNYNRYLTDFRKKGNVVICTRAEADKRPDLKQLVSYVLLKDEKGDILSYRRGSYSAIADFLKGVLCIGFGGHVDEKDYLDIFDHQNFGIFRAASRETIEELKGVIPRNLRLLGVINDESSPLGLKHFAFVLEGTLPPTFDIAVRSTELSINRLKKMTEAEIWMKYHELEFWSQLICKSLFRKPDSYNPVIIQAKQHSNLKGPFIIAGEIGSGKTEVSKHLCSKFNYRLISSRKCIASLINAKDFKDNNRSNFQNKSADLVYRRNGIERLVDSIKKRVDFAKTSSVIIDGIRNIETYDRLKSLYPNCVLIYVETPRDKAFKLINKENSRGVSISEFREARHHPVEKEISFLKSRADIYFFNGGGLSVLFRSLDEWWFKHVQI